MSESNPEQAPEETPDTDQPDAQPDPSPETNVDAEQVVVNQAPDGGGVDNNEAESE